MVSSNATTLYYNAILKAKAIRLEEAEAERDFFRKCCFKLLVAQTQEEKEAIKWAISTYIEQQNQASMRKYNANTTGNPTKEKAATRTNTGCDLTHITCIRELWNRFAK